MAWRCLPYDYYIPDLTLDDDADYEIGVYGRMRERFLEEHHHGTYTSLLLTGKLRKHLADIDTACHERMDFLISAMAKRDGVTEALKSANQMEWVGLVTLVQSKRKNNLWLIFLI
ncbi:MAG: TnpV protein [Oscillospiraceae bacterium]|nr:TnpV protein [Oscillospiraceae bacterium]